MAKSLILILGLFISGLVSQSVQANDQALIKRAIVTSAIVEREPIDQLSKVSVDADKVYFFTEVVNQANTHLTHKWLLNGRLEAEVVLKIGSNRWRTYSSKHLDPALHTGQWQVLAVDQQNNILAEATFSY